jgi:hypothetical protein
MSTAAGVDRRVSPSPVSIGSPMTAADGGPQLILDDYKWAYDVEMTRAERADNFGAALITVGVATGALVATLLKDRDITGKGSRQI